MQALCAFDAFAVMSPSARGSPCVNVKSSAVRPGIRFTGHTAVRRGRRGQLCGMGQVRRGRHHSGVALEAASDDGASMPVGDEGEGASLPAGDDAEASNAQTEGSTNANAKTDAVEEKNEDKAESPSNETKDGGDEASPAEAISMADDDVAPALEGDWRDFRAMLVASEAGEASDGEGGKMGSKTRDDAAITAASGENLALLKKQNPELAAEKPWAHAIGSPEKGCLLVASEGEFKLGQQYFHQAVILILEHHEKGSMGVILNRPTQYNMGYVSGDASGPFSKNELYFGGDVGDGTVSFLHGESKVNGSAEVLPGVYLGGYESACELVGKGEVGAGNFKFFARYCGWAPGQLESECERGVWYPVACSKQLALKPVIQLPKPLWREVLELCGGHLEEASKRAYGELDEEEGTKDASDDQ